jgi:GNAT superfamily N-acetyltransferase
MELIFLADRPDAIPIIARWYFDQWGYLDEGGTVEKICGRMQKFLNKDSIPLMVLAVEADKIMGVAELKYHEMDIYPEKEHWIGGVFVAPEHRGRGFASCILNKIIEIAPALDVNILNLQTEKLDGGLYTRLGWKRYEQVIYHGLEVLVMEKQLDSV